MKTVAVIFMMTTPVFASDWNLDAEGHVIHTFTPVESEQQILTLEELMLMQVIMTAYPDNPGLWRYLERNPRYLPLYLPVGQ